MPARKPRKPAPKPKAKPSAKPATVATLTAVAKHFGVNRRTVADWKNEGAPLDAAPFNLEAIDVWHRAHTAKSQTQQTPKRAEYQERILAADAERAEHELAVLRRQAMPVELVTQLYERSIAETKTRLEQLADNVLAHFPRIKPAVARRLVDAITEEVEKLAAKMAGVHEELAHEMET